MGGGANACRVPQGGAGVLVTLAPSFLGASQLKLELFTFVGHAWAGKKEKS